MSEVQSFAYEKVKDGICILRCYGVSSKVEVPKKLEGLPVTELSAYAFADETAKEPENTSGLPCICGAALEELYLPETIRRLGRYVFYNCIQFRKLSFYSNIAFMGAGGFTGCEKLSHLVMHQKEGASCLREILQDLKQPVTVDCYWEQRQVDVTDTHSVDGGLSGTPGDSCGQEGFKCRLVYPEFFEEAVENTPARIISTQTHGMGIQYRNTFRDTKIIFSEYDKLFETGKYNIDLINIIEMATARLSYPYKLEDSAKERYSAWLRQHLKEAARYFLEQGKAEELRWMSQTFVETREELEVLLQEANDRKDAEELSFLMDVLHRRFSGKKKRFML